jgi:hypothetical protein
LPLGSGTLRRALKEYGGPVNHFAVDVLGRSRVSVWRWIQNREQIPGVVRHRLKRYLQFPYPRYADTVDPNAPVVPIDQLEEFENE